MPTVSARRNRSAPAALPLRGLSGETGSPSAKRLGRRPTRNRNAACARRTSCRFRPAPNLGPFATQPTGYSEVGKERWTPSTPQDAARSMSSCFARHQAVSRHGSRRRATARIAAHSCSPIAGVPISNSPTPISARAVAMATLSAREGHARCLLAVAQRRVDKIRGASVGRSDHGCVFALRQATSSSSTGRFLQRVEDLVELLLRRLRCTTNLVDRPRSRDLSRIASDSPCWRPWRPAPGRRSPLPAFAADSRRPSVADALRIAADPKAVADEEMVVGFCTGVPFVETTV